MPRNYTSNPRKGKGRWSKEEHEGFLLGLQNYGRDWDTIGATFVPWRTVAQIRTHAQKYFAKIEQGLPFPEVPYDSMYSAVDGSGDDYTNEDTSGPAGGVAVSYPDLSAASQPQATPAAEAAASGQSGNFYCHANAFGPHGAQPRVMSPAPPSGLHVAPPAHGHSNVWEAESGNYYGHANAFGPHGAQPRVMSPAPPPGPHFAPPADGHSNVWEAESGNYNGFANAFGSHGAQPRVMSPAAPPGPHVAPPADGHGHFWTANRPMQGQYIPAPLEGMGGIAEGGWALPHGDFTLLENWSASVGDVDESDFLLAAGTVHREGGGQISSNPNVNAAPHAQWISSSVAGNTEGAGSSRWDRGPGY